MPVIINERNPNPFAPLPGTHYAIGITRAKHQDIRPLEILVVNLMSDKETTARLLSEWLGDTPLQVRLTFAATDSWIKDIENGREPENTDPQYIKQFIYPFSAVKDKNFDGVVVTGFNAKKERVDEETLYGETTEIIDHAESHATSSLYLCYGAKAALLHRHGIHSKQKPKGEKYFGVFDFAQRPDLDFTGILRGLPDVFPVPVARMKSPCAEEIFKNKHLRTLATSIESGPGIMVETAYHNGNIYPKHVYVLPHPEYDPHAMHKEYERDKRNGVNIPFPKGLYRNNDPAQGTVNSWRHTGRIYTNWVNAIYEATPFDRAQISGTHQRASVAEVHA